MSVLELSVKHGMEWNGIVCREHNTIQKLQNIFPQINYVKVAGEIDYGYAIDYELYLMIN